VARSTQPSIIAPVTLPTRFTKFCGQSFPCGTSAATEAHLIPDGFLG